MVDTLPSAVNRQPPRGARGFESANPFALLRSPEPAPTQAARPADDGDDFQPTRPDRAAEDAASRALTDQRFALLSPLTLDALKKLCKEKFGLKVNGTKDALKRRIAESRKGPCNEYFAKRRTVSSYPGFGSGSKPAAPPPRTDGSTEQSKRGQGPAQSQPRGKRGRAKLGRGPGSLRPGGIRPPAQRQRQRKAQERRHSGSSGGEGGRDEDLDALLNGDERAVSATVPALPSVCLVRPSGLWVFFVRAYVRRSVCMCIHIRTYYILCVCVRGRTRRAVAGRGGQ